MQREPLSPDLVKRIVTRFAQVGLQTAITALIIFACAGSATWWPGWLYVGLLVASMVFMGVWVLPRNPEVIAERSRLHKDTKTFDKVMVALMTLTTGAIYVVGALDNGRYHWAPLAWPWSIAGAVLMLAAVVPVAGAMSVNRRLATTVRIEGAGHELATEGPYRFVRHPFYLGSLLQYPAVALVFGSAWALVPAAVSAVVLFIRTALEDRTLRRELPGYEEYAQRTRYRLIPGVW